MQCRVTNSVVLLHLLYNIPLRLPKSTPADIPKRSCTNVVLDMAAHPWFDVTTVTALLKETVSCSGCALFRHLRYQPPPDSPVCKTTLLLAPSDLLSLVYIAREATRGLLAANMKVLVSLCVFVPLLALATAGKDVLLLSIAQWHGTEIWSYLSEVPTSDLKHFSTVGKGETLGFKGKRNQWLKALHVKITLVGQYVSHFQMFGINCRPFE